MSKMSKRTLIATTVIGAFALGNSAVVSADPLNDLHKEEAKIHVAAKKSQEKINSLFEQSQELLVEYRAVIDETENLKVYNDYVASSPRNRYTLSSFQSHQLRHGTRPIIPEIAQIKS